MNRLDPARRGVERAALEEVAAELRSDAERISSAAPDPGPVVAARAVLAVQQAAADALDALAHELQPAASRVANGRRGGVAGRVTRLAAALAGLASALQEHASDMQRARADALAGRAEAAVAAGRESTRRLLDEVQPLLEVTRGAVDPR